MKPIKLSFFSGEIDNIYFSLAEELNKNSQIEFRFINVNPFVDKERDDHYRYDLVEMVSPYIINYNGINFETLHKISIESDVAIFAGIDRKFYKERIKQNRLTYFFHERIFKNGLYDLFNVKHLLIQIYSHSILPNKSVYMFYKGASAASDFGLIGAYRNRLIKWGYFSSVNNISYKDLLKIKNYDSSIRILWVGRMVTLKNPQIVIEVASYLTKLNFDFILNVIGDGPLLDELKTKSKRMNLEHNINFHGAQSSTFVKDYMDRSHIFLFTSDSREGWGFTLNEAMRSACTVIANHNAGSTKILIRDGENGYIYKNHSELISKLNDLLLNPDLLNYLGKGAYSTIEKYWNAEVASNALIEFSKSILAGKTNINKNIMPEILSDNSKLK